MWLTLDIGNSGLKAGLFDEERLVRHQTWPTESRFESELRTWIGEDAVTRIGLSSVVPAISERIRRAGTLTVSHAVNLPFTIEYERPELLGTDRIAAAVAAWMRYGPHAPVVIVDAGTTATIDVVFDGRFLGGTIAPGPLLLMQSLAERTAALPSVPLSMPSGPYGQSTESALQHGVMHGFIDTVQGAIRRTSRALPESPVIVATGGWHLLVADRIAAIDHVMPHLVLRGIREIMRLNP